MFKKWEAIIDNNKLEKVYFIARNRRDAVARVNDMLKDGAEVVRIKEYPDIMPSAEYVVQALRSANFGEAECGLMLDILSHIEATDAPAYPKY